MTVGVIVTTTGTMYFGAVNFFLLKVENGLVQSVLHA